MSSQITKGCTVHMFCLNLDKIFSLVRAVYQAMVDFRKQYEHSSAEYMNGTVNAVI